MQKKKFFLTVFSLFLLLSASITWAQTISSQKGLTTAIFTSVNGTVKLFLPDDIRPGDNISGRIIAIPLGNNVKQAAKNLAILSSYTIYINNEKYTVNNEDHSIQFTLPNENSTGCQVTFSNEVGLNVGQFIIAPATVNDQKPSASHCNIPSHALAGAPLRITGTFDGNASNTNCSLANNPLQVLAESPRQCIINYPPTATGIEKLNMQEKGNPPCSKQIVAVKMNLSAGKLNLLKGEKTYINVEITGLQNLPDTAKLTLKNITTDIVIMQPSNNIFIPLLPDTAVTTTFNRRFDILSIKTGTFTVNVNLDLPEIDLQQVSGPVMQENNGETTQPTQPQDPNNSRCTCEASCNVKQTMLKGNEASYEVEIKAACKGTSGSGSSRATCELGPIKYTWFIGESGKDVVAIVGKADGKSVTVKHLKAGNYTIYVSGLVTCSDGKTCPITCSWEQTVPPPTVAKACMPSLTHFMEPLMNGGLVNTYFGNKNSKTLRRDDFIILEADGADFDIAKLICNKMYDCPDAGCDKQTPIAGKVKFEWEITGTADTRGSFVQIGCIPDDSKAKGEHVIFKPPYVPLPVILNDTAVKTTIILSIIDAGSVVPDPTVKKIITITTTRSKNKPDFYASEVNGGTYKPTKTTVPSSSSCACNPIGPNWVPGDNLITPDIILPSASADNNKLVQGQWILLTTSDQTDMDMANYTCVSASSCPTGSIVKAYEDVIKWQWKVEGGGRIVLSDQAQFVVYEAPTEFPAGKDFLDIKLTLTVSNPAGRADPIKNFTADKIIRVYKAGIRMNYPPLTWLPDEKDTLELKSELVYQSDKTWLPAFDHMCRVHYVEMVNVSQEKGICMNYPSPDKANKCFDLQLVKLKEDNIELFAATKQESSKCTLKDQFMQARSGKPVKEFTIKINSLDFGAYGFIRSFANINYGIVDKVDKGRDKETVEYKAVPWQKADVPHPLGGKRVKLNVYDDNRVNIPYDVDENHVADNGWTTMTGKKMDDPEFVLNDAPADAKMIKDAKKNNQVLFPANDAENIPLGDGFRGDGYGSYEEYRGFKVIADKKEQHIRTDITIKDIFICNENEFELDTYKDVSGLDVYEINHLQFESMKKKSVNFNFSQNTHVVDQFGLYLVNRGYHKSLMGIARSNNNKPTTPNFEIEVSIYKEKIIEISKKFGLNEKMKIQAVVAHELLHANNVCHHGEGNEAVENSHDVLHGLRSGDIYCVMHYDNSGTRRDIDFIPEPIGNKLCTNSAGTGYNAPANELTDKTKHLYFGTTLEGRGNCVHQIRVSGRGGQPTSCGDRFDEKGALKREFKEKRP